MASRDNSVNDEPLNEAEGNIPLDNDYSESQSLESTVANNIFNDCTFNIENAPVASNFSSQLTIALIVELIILIPALLFQNLSQDDESFTGAILPNQSPGTRQ